MTRLLITGSGGRLGTLLQAAFHRDGSDVDVVFQSSKPGMDVQWRVGDPLFKLPKTDAVLALWGVTRGDDEALAHNSQLAFLSDEVAEATGAHRVFHCSTAAIYGPGQEMFEDRPPAPINAYGAAKLEMERHIRGFVESEGKSHTVLRLANIVGADSLAPSLTSDDPVTLHKFADGKGPLRSYLAASDLLRITYALMQNPPSSHLEVLNLAAPHPVEMEALARAAGKQIIWQDAPETAVQEVSLNTQRLSNMVPKAIKHRNAKEMIADWQSVKGR
ncbi:MAG: SDR family oxidoreductase [Pseudomonadota bacterium]